MAPVAPLALTWLRLATGETQPNIESDSNDNMLLENWH